MLRQWLEHAACWPPLLAPALNAVEDSVDSGDVSDPVVSAQGAQTAPKQATSKKKASQKSSKPAAKKDTNGQDNPVTKAMVAARVIPPARHETKKAGKPAAKKEARMANKKATKDSVPREFSKKAIVLDLLRRKDGATMAEIAKATGWQNHSIRGFISGNLTKKMGLVVESAKNEAGERTYRIAK